MEVSEVEYEEIQTLCIHIIQELKINDFIKMKEMIYSNVQTLSRGVFSGGARGAMAPLMIWDLKEKNWIFGL